MSGTQRVESESKIALPIKLRHKQETKQASELRSQDEHVTPQIVENPFCNTQASEKSKEQPKASKIAGIALKTGPRIGTRYQADIPDLQR